MCLSTVFELWGDERKKVAEHVTGVTIIPGAVKLSDILGAELEIKGSIKSIDLMANEIIISPEN